MAWYWCRLKNLPVYHGDSPTSVGVSQGRKQTPHPFGWGVCLQQSKEGELHSLGDDFLLPYPVPTRVPGVVFDPDVILRFTAVQVHGTDWACHPASIVEAEGHDVTQGIPGGWAFLLGDDFLFPYPIASITVGMLGVVFNHDTVLGFMPIEAHSTDFFRELASIVEAEGHDVTQGIPGGWASPRYAGAGLLRRGRACRGGCASSHIP